MQCPKCHGLETIVKKTLPMLLFLGRQLDIDDSDYDGDITFSESDPAECSDCDWKGTFSELVYEPDDITPSSPE